MADYEPKDWELRQARTFAKWCNMYLAKKGIEDRAVEGKEFGSAWTTGILLMKLMNALYDVPMPKKYKKEPKHRVHCLDNVNLALKALETAEVKTTHLKQTNLLDGDFKMMCGMCWNVILDYNIKGISVEDSTAKQGLLIWCRKKTQGYRGVDGKIDNFTKDWQNGNAFLALIDRHTTNLVDYEKMYDCKAEEKLDEAFTAAEKLGIPRLLEVEDLTECVPDDKAVMTYVSELFKLFSKEDIKENAALHIGKFLKFQQRMESLGGDYEARFQEFVDWAENKCDEFENAEPPSSNIEAGEGLANYKTYLIDEKPHKMADVVDIQDLFANIQGELKVNGRKPYAPPDGKDPEQLNSLKERLQAAEAKYCEMVRNTRLQFIEKLDDGSNISEERMGEFEKSFEAFDADKSGHLNKIEFKAALSAVGIALNEEDFDRVFDELATEGNIEKDTYIQYLVSFFSTSDTSESVLKSLQVLGDPENVSEEMFAQPPLSEEDVAYLMAKAEDGSLAQFVSDSFL